MADTPTTAAVGAVAELYLGNILFALERCALALDEEGQAGRGGVLSRHRAQARRGARRGSRRPRRRVGPAAAARGRSSSSARTSDAGRDTSRSIAASGTAARPAVNTRSQRADR